ncbi:MAG: lysophospholipid acyltransferase family protein [Rhodospirillales bacterium]
MSFESVRRILSWLGACYIRLVYLTGRWTVMGDETPRRFWDQGEPFILAFWHGRIMMLPYCWNRGTAMHLLISRHRDGRLIARIVGTFGIGTVAGSTTHGGRTALRALVKALKAGDCVGITPDGPRGPRMRASSGIVSIACLSGAPIIPVTYSTSRKRILSTWDRFLVVWPFARGVLVWGDPIHVPRDADETALESARRQVEDALNAITEEAERLCGGETVEPMPVAGDSPP